MTELGRRGDSASRRVIDLAIGILMGLRGCSEREAFDDLVNAVHETSIGPAGLAGALVDLVGGARGDVPHRSEAMHVWGHVLATPGDIGGWPGRLMRRAAAVARCGS
jgi:ANTAR domain